MGKEQVKDHQNYKNQQMWNTCISPKPLPGVHRIKPLSYMGLLSFDNTATHSMLNTMVIQSSERQRLWIHGV